MSMNFLIACFSLFYIYLNCLRHLTCVHPARHIRSDKVILQMCLLVKTFKMLRIPCML